MSTTLLVPSAAQYFTETVMGDKKISTCNFCQRLLNNFSSSNKGGHLSNPTIAGIAKVSLCVLVPAEVSEIFVSYKQKRQAATTLKIILNY